MSRVDIKEKWLEYPLLKKLWLSFATGAIVALLFAAIFLIYLLGAYAYREFIWGSLGMIPKVKNSELIADLVFKFIILTLVSGILNLVREAVGSATLKILNIELAYSYANAIIAISFGTGILFWLQKYNTDTRSSFLIWLITIIATLICTAIYSFLCETIRNTFLYKIKKAKRVKNL